LEQIITDLKTFLLPNQACQSTKRNSKHRYQPKDITHWTSCFLDPSTVS